MFTKHSVWGLIVGIVVGVALLVGALMFADYTTSDSDTQAVCTQSRTVYVPVWMGKTFMMMPQTRCERYEVQQCQQWTTEKHFGKTVKVCQGYQ